MSDRTIGHGPPDRYYLFEAAMTAEMDDTGDSLGADGAFVQGDPLRRDKDWVKTRPSPTIVSEANCSSP
eukprot:1021802-Prorocentrum_minimum.AAC.1